MLEKMESLCPLYPRCYMTEKKEAVVATSRKRSVQESSSDDRPIPDLWQPQWFVDVGSEVTVGIAMDDGCYVVLLQQPTGQWRPTTHIPVEAAKMIGRLSGS